MVQGEAYLLCNFGLCACALPLGGKLAGLPFPSVFRLVMAALLGGGCALGAVFYPSLLWGLSLPAGVALCFGNNGSQAVVRCMATTLCASLLSGGTVLFLLNAQAPPFLAGLGAGALTLLLYAMATLLPTAMIQVRQVELAVGEREVLLPAMVDSGNLLRDPITGLPVLVVPIGAARALFPCIGAWWERQELPQGFRLLNVRTAAGGGLLPLFRPDLCRMYFNGRAFETELLVAVAGLEYGGVQALVPLAALPTECLE